MADRVKGDAVKIEFWCRKLISYTLDQHRRSATRCTAAWNDHPVLLRRHYHAAIQPISTWRNTFRWVTKLSSIIAH